MSIKILLSLMLSLIIIALLITTQTTQDNNVRTYPPGSFKSLTIMNAIRAYPGKDIPADAYTRAFEYSCAFLRYPSRETMSWESIGPKNIGGRTLDLSLNQQNPNTIYAASASGGLWRSYSGGVGKNAWERLELGYPVLAIGAIEVSPTDTNIIFAGTGECYGFGTSHLYRSDDGGDTWTDIGSMLPDIPGWSVVNDPLNPNIIYYGNEFGIYVSYNNGQSWSEFNEGLGDGVFAMDLKISASNRKLRVATHGNGVYEKPIESTIGIDENRSNYSDALKFTNYPNPFHDQTTLRFELAKKARVHISVNDLSGKLVEALADKQFSAGTHEITFKVNPSLRVKNGVYICRLIAGDQIRTLKLQVIGW